MRRVFDQRSNLGTHPKSRRLSEGSDATYHHPSLHHTFLASIADNATVAVFFSRSHGVHLTKWRGRGGGEKRLSARSFYSCGQVRSDEPDLALNRRAVGLQLGFKIKVFETHGNVTCQNKLYQISGWRGGEEMNAHVECLVLWRDRNRGRGNKYG